MISSLLNLIFKMILPHNYMSDHTQGEGLYRICSLEITNLGGHLRTLVYIQCYISEFNRFEE